MCLSLLCIFFRIFAWLVEALLSERSQATRRELDVSYLTQLSILSLQI